MRICLWHGWLLEGSGSNVYTARTAEALRTLGHDVVLLSQEAHPERYPWIDAWGTVNHEVGALMHTGSSPSQATGRCVLLRPQIGAMLPVFVWDEYEGFDVKTFVDLTDRELEEYLAVNVLALKSAVAWHGSQAVIAGHAIPGAVIARRAVGDGGYISNVHGSDLEYAIRLQERYVDLAREGLEGARAVAGPSEDALRRAREFVPAIADKEVVVHPGVEVERFRLRERPEALARAAALLQGDVDAQEGRRPDLNAEVLAAVAAREAKALARLAGRYDQAAPDPGARDALEALAAFEGPLIGFLGKFIPQKGAERLIESLALLGGDARGLLIGFGTFREWLEALALILHTGDVESYAWLREQIGVPLALTDDEVRASTGLMDRLTFTGRLDHRYAPATLGALDVIVVPSTLAESFGMVAPEGAAAGALPLVARHSGLAEIAAALEGAVDRPGLFSYAPGEGATRHVAEGIRTLLALPAEERGELREAISAYVNREWSWASTAQQLLAAATR